MSDFWIKIEKSTPDKPEIFEIAEILDIDPDAVVGKLVRVWSWLDSNCDNGHIKSVTPILIDRLTTCKGFADAMVSAGWLTSDYIPNFERHLGKSAKKRANDSERQRKSREKKDICHTPTVTKKRLDKSRVDKSKDIVIPDGINQLAWNEWVEFRKAKKKVSKAAATKQFNLLLKYNDHEQQAIINQSIQNDYQGLFELKDQPNQQKQVGFIENHTDTTWAEGL